MHVKLSRSVFEPKQQCRGFASTGTLGRGGSHRGGSRLQEASTAASAESESLASTGRQRRARVLRVSVTNSCTTGILSQTR